MTSARITSANKLAALLASPAIRLDVYRKIRQAFKGVRALCAATASEYLIRAGVLSGYRPWTSQLESALRERGWVTVGGPPSRPQLGAKQQANTVTTAGGDGAPPLRPFDLCYSVDANHNGASDHVFFFIRWLNRGKLVAEVVDNYALHPHPRNLGAPCWHGGKRLAYGKFSHAQRMPQRV